ncbi:Zinc finger RING-type [Arabidopsis suecica]|uniref:Zinc finger RING-type n=1 Tax=Arabidopsis suecica TaxID=45249 RepID=A0A8T2H5U1_ARASU|nr:Zinc finger RING-type [Arabidopsis suecica]
MEAEISFGGEIDLKPKSQDAGLFKICVSARRSDTSISLPPNFVLSYNDYEGVISSYPNDSKKLNDWLYSAGLSEQYVDIANSQLTERICKSISMVDSSVCATLVYMYCKVIVPPRIDSFDETTNNIELIRPANKLVVDRLARKVYNKKKKSNSDASVCTICLEEFEKGEIVVTLPCGHEFDDGCIGKWFLKDHVCPLCRFELPC